VNVSLNGSRLATANVCIGRLSHRTIRLDAQETLVCETVHNYRESGAVDL